MRESNPRFRFVGATRYRYANRAGTSLGIPGRIRTCDSRFVVWNDLRFTTGTRFTGAMTTGVEPVTFAVTRQDSDQLSYATMFLRSGTWIRTRRDGLTVRSFTC